MDKEFIRQIAFPIYKGKNKENSEFEGTGFLINEEGHFISAGHVFKESDNKYFAWINNTMHEIECVLNEYVEPENQIAPIYKDIFIGIVKQLISNSYDLCFSKTLNKADNYIAYGYIENTKLLLKDTPATLLFRFAPSGDENFENIWMPKGNDIEPGMSGGIVIYENSVKGLVLARGKILEPSYIIEKLQKLGIKHHIE